MANFPGRGLMANRPASILYDRGVLTRNFPTGIARGHTEPDYNASLRGLGKRADIIKPTMP